MGLAPPGVELDSDESMLIDAAREYARSELLPLDRSWDRDESSVVEVLPQLGEMGLLSLVLPEELGGVGCSYRAYAAILHEIARYSPSVCVTLSVHNMVGSILSAYLAEPERTSWLTQWSKPEGFSAFALTEAGAGSDAGATMTTAIETGDGFRITGEKMWITNGITARWFLTLVRLEGTQRQEGLCAVLIDGRDAGVERTKIEGKMGIRGSETAVIHLTDVHVPRSRLIGERGRGLQVFLSTLNEGRIGIGAQSTGISEACVDEMVSYSRQREQFGQPISSFQAVGEMLADSKVELEASKALVWSAACKVDSGESDRRASAQAKLYASEAANRIAYRAVQIHAGTGYVNECRVEQLYRDARITTIYEGTSEIQRIIVARELGAAG